MVQPATTHLHYLATSLACHPFHTTCLPAACHPILCSFLSYRPGRLQIATAERRGLDGTGTATMTEAWETYPAYPHLPQPYLDIVELPGMGLLQWFPSGLTCLQAAQLPDYRRTDGQGSTYHLPRHYYHHACLPDKYLTTGSPALKRTCHNACLPALPPAPCHATPGTFEKLGLEIRDCSCLCATTMPVLPLPPCLPPFYHCHTTTHRQAEPSTLDLQLPGTASGLPPPLFPDITLPPTQLPTMHTIPTMAGLQFEGLELATTHNTTFGHLFEERHLRGTTVCPHVYHGRL